MDSYIFEFLLEHPDVKIWLSRHEPTDSFAIRLSRDDRNIQYVIDSAWFKQDRFLEFILNELLGRLDDISYERFDQYLCRVSEPLR